MVLSSLLEKAMRRRVAWSVSSILPSLFLAIGQILSAQSSPTAPARTYVWQAELVSFDSASKTMTAKAAVNEAVVKYLDRFKPGQRVVLIWTADNSKPETGPVRYIENYDAMKSANVNQGYMLPAEFVAGDTSARTVTFKAGVPDAAAQALTAAPPGRSISVTSPMAQPSEAGIITSVALPDRPASAPQQR